MVQLFSKFCSQCNRSIHHHLLAKAGELRKLLSKLSPFFQLLCNYQPPLIGSFCECYFRILKQTYRLLCLRSTTPEELYARKVCVHIVAKQALIQCCSEVCCFNLVPRASVMEREVESLGKGWLSHDQIFQYIWKIYYRN